MHKTQLNIYFIEFEYNDKNYQNNMKSNFSNCKKSFKWINLVTKNLSYEFESNDKIINEKFKYKCLKFKTKF